jgi:hypothetical protein
VNQQWLLHEFFNSLYMKEKLLWVAFGTTVGLPKNGNGRYKRSEYSGLLLFVSFFYFFFVGSKKENGSECSGFGSKCSFGIIKKLRVLW